MRLVRSLAFVATLPILSLTVGCSSGGLDDDIDDTDTGADTDTGDTGGDGDGDGDGDCYMTSSAGTGIMGSWAEANDKKEHMITVPDEPGGGFVRIALNTSHPDVVPWLRVQASGDMAGAIINGSAATTADEQTKKGVFSVAPGMTYVLGADQFYNAPPEDYPVGYTLTWEYVGVVDCYEPNDDADAAQAIELDDLIEAYAHTGHLTNSITSIAYDDWYSVTLEADADLSVELVTVPGSQHRMRIRIWDETGGMQLAIAGGNMGGELFTATAAGLAAGTYLISVEAPDNEWPVSLDDNPDPESFTQPYEIRATAG